MAERHILAGAHQENFFVNVTVVVIVVDIDATETQLSASPRDIRANNVSRLQCQAVEISITDRQASVDVDGGIFSCIKSK